MVVPSAIAEVDADDGAPEATVLVRALRKARAVAESRPDVPVLGADTEVVLDGRLMGKPETRDAAATMLARLSGREHKVMTGVALCLGTREETALAEARVRFVTLDAQAIETYLDRAAYADKAGAYGIQEEGAELIASFNGRRDTIIGLPMDVVDALWRSVVQSKP